MLSKQKLIEELSRLEERIAWLKAQLQARRSAKKPVVSLAGKFPQLNALAETEIDEATRLWEREFKG